MRPSQYKYDTLYWHQILNGYAMGIFPMGEDEKNIAWFEASPRAILPVENINSGLNIPRSLKQVLNKKYF